jgi:hypothetical protein
MRRFANPGKREREAGKRHRRGQIYSAAMTDWLKLGHKHFSRSIRSSLLSVADSRNARSQGRVMSLSPNLAHHLDLADEAAA